MENFKKQIDYYTIQDIADKLDFCYNKVNKLVKDEQIPAYKIGREFRIDKQDFREYLQNCKYSKKKKKTNTKRNIIKKPRYENKYGISLAGN